MYNKWDSVKVRGMWCFDEIKARLHKEARVYVDYEVPIKEVMGLEAETSSQQGQDRVVLL